MVEIVALICDGIDGTCITATKEDFADKHIMMREKIAKHQFPIQNLRGQLLVEKYNGWTDDQTLVIVDLSPSNLKKFKKQGFKIPEEFLPKKKEKKKTTSKILMRLNNLIEDRYEAIEDFRKILNFTKSEWRILLCALAKTDNGWLNYMLGDFEIKIIKIVDINRLKFSIELNKKGKVLKTINYEFNLEEFK